MAVFLKTGSVRDLEALVQRSSPLQAEPVRSPSGAERLLPAQTWCYRCRSVATVPMIIRYKVRKLACAIAAFGFYFAAAHWLQATYTPNPYFAFGPDVPGEKIRLVPPFAQFEGSKFAVAKERYNLFDELADSEDNNTQSTIELYENNTRLGPAHSNHPDIAHLGGGRFSHWRKNGTTVYWSSSDNTNPMTNGRAYWVVRPPQSGKH
ncbi:hypothetical protein J6524_23320 [Bradyrhizobium sp. WSM 1738]|uniref:hypothetical protein n=1 Tax=Bradyrhizobium hereditatis TaxID=2821405 RepID=UPI001CE3801A|nr:hypothetical protein [Bradyrhizobium hereditatis]MCA6117782.1 hypothetical protein [Bradyrhizobium hereditatis]